MYLEHFGLREAPFKITPHTDYFFTGAQRGAILEACRYALEHDEGILKIVGEVGTGKTMLCRMLIENLLADTQSIYLANPSLNPEQLLQTVAAELDIETAYDRPVPSLLRTIEERLIAAHAAGHRVVVLIDEAHAMPRESLETIRLLSNLETPSRKLLQVVLFGQPELDGLLAQHAMRPLRERVTQNFPLQLLSRTEIAAYIRFRLHAAGYRGDDIFTFAALQALSRAAQGLTRRVNILADKAMLAAFLDRSPRVTRRHVLAAIRDADYPGTQGFRRYLPLWVAALILTALGAWLVHA